MSDSGPAKRDTTGKRIANPSPLHLKEAGCNVASLMYSTDITVKQIYDPVGAQGVNGATTIERMLFYIYVGAFSTNAARVVNADEQFRCSLVREGSHNRSLRLVAYRCCGVQSSFCAHW